MLPWYKEATPDQWRVLLAASLGWMLDSMDVMLYSMVLAHLMGAFQMTPSKAGLLNSFTLIASAIGGILFGLFADRFGRTKALSGSILLYSIFTGACGFAQNIIQLAAFRILLGFGMGGEWASGAALVAETWPEKHRGKALGFMQSSWAIGYATAAAVVGLVLPRFGWRFVFWVGFLPALITLWIRSSIKEPAIWQQRSEKKGSLSGLKRIFRPPHLKNTCITSLMNAGTMFGYWGLFTWIPAYLGLPQEKGGAGLGIVSTSQWIILMQAGTWAGYVTFGFLSDKLGRKFSYIGFLLIATVLVPVYGHTHDPRLLLILGPWVGFFGVGYFSGFGAITAELFPTEIRATAQGFTYNIGRGISAIAPYAVGKLAESYGLGFSFYLVSAAFLFSAFAALALPETKGRQLE